MKEYNKPLIDVVREAAEGVYATSGTSGTNMRNGFDLSTYKPHCESKYMSIDTFQLQNNEGTTNKTKYGCNGCRAYSATGCQMKDYEVGDWYVAEYDWDIGYRKPEWEQKGWLPDSPAGSY